MRIFKLFHERLFILNRQNAVLCSAKASVDFVPITNENAHLVRALRGDEFYRQFVRQLELGDFGLYACKGDAVVGYGWAKHSGSDDFFFRVGDDAVYLCRFFVKKEERGRGIYPALITRLIEKESKTDSFYIAVERGNESSERGLKKVGFTFVREYGFVRGLKRTFNKKKLSASVIMGR